MARNQLLSRRGAGLLALAGLELLLVLAVAGAVWAGVATTWTRLYNGPISKDDLGAALVLDGQGNVYVTGQSQRGAEFLYSNEFATIKYSPSGQTIWTQRFGDPSEGSSIDMVPKTICADGQGNIFVTGSRSFFWYPLTFISHVTVKYSPSGQELWSKVYSDPNYIYGAEFAEGSLVSVISAQDAWGNLYLTGISFFDVNHDGHCPIIKYSSDGQQLWTQTYYNSPNSSDNVATAIASDGANIYVTGRSKSAANGYDYLTIKYEASGNQIWASRYNGPGNGVDWATGIAVDVQGNVYVTGRSYGGTGTDYDYATIKYDTKGTEQWVRRYNGPINTGQDKAYAIAVDGQGNIYVTGTSFEEVGKDFYYATIKYDSDGNEKWVRRYNGPGDRSDMRQQLAFDGQGNIYLTANSKVPGPDFDYVTIKFDANGNEKWVQRYSGPYDHDVAQALTVDGQGNVYVTGYSWRGIENTWYDYATIKYRQTGKMEGALELLLLD